MMDAQRRERAVALAEQYVDECCMTEGIAAITVALADAERRGMERAAKICELQVGALTLENCRGCGNEDDIAAAASSDTAIYLAELIYKAQAGEESDGA